MNLSRNPICRYCQQPFIPSLFHPQQAVCRSAACQRQRRSDYHRAKLAREPDYQQTCRDSRQKWRDRHPGYQREYRNRRPAYVERNRSQQEGRNRRRHLEGIVKNNLALDVKRLATEVWMTGPGLEVIVKNNLAISEVLVFHLLSQGRRDQCRRL